MIFSRNSALKRRQSTSVVEEFPLTESNLLVNPDITVFGRGNLSGRDIIAIKSIVATNLKYVYHAALINPDSLAYKFSGLGMTRIETTGLGMSGAEITGTGMSGIELTRIGMGEVNFQVTMPVSLNPNTDRFKKELQEQFPQINTIEEDVISFLYFQPDLVATIAPILDVSSGQIKGNFQIGLKLLRYEESTRATMFIQFMVDFESNDAVAILEQLNAFIVKTFDPSQSSLINISLYPIDAI